MVNFRPNWLDYPDDDLEDPANQPFPFRLIIILFVIEAVAVGGFVWWVI